MQILPTPHVIHILTEAKAKIVTEERGLPDVVNAMATHPNNADLIETAAAALLSLSMEGKWDGCSICTFFKSGPTR